MALRNNRPEGIYATILGSDGSIRVTAKEDTPGAVKREYETSDGAKKEKWELVFTELEGYITNIYFKDSNYGRTINLVIKDGEEDPVIFQMNTESSFASDLMKRLPNIDLEVKVLFRPYSFDNDDGKKVKGLSIQQSGEKLQDFFSKEDPKDSTKKTAANGIPTPDEDKKPEPTKKAAWKKYWKGHFSDVEEFLVEYTENNIIPNIPDAKAQAETEKAFDDDF